MNIDKYYKEDGYYDKDECYYKDTESFIITGIFDLADGREAIETIAKVFEHFNTWTETNKYWDDLVNDVFNGNEGAAYISASLLDNKGFIEYGTSIRGSWLTDEGKEIYADCLEIIERWANETR